MKKFIYSRPDDIKAATAKLKSRCKVQALAGGTDLLGTLKYKNLPDSPAELVSLKGLGLDYIKEDKDMVKIGAMTTLAEMDGSDVIKKFPVLWQAVRQVAAPQIRNMATVGGNICQEPRCWYYRYQDNKFNCMRKGGQFCNALTGNNTYHSVFGAAKVCDTACQKACPNETDISAYMDKLRKGNLKEAAEILFHVNPIASVTGRVCPHTCQSECSRHLFDQSVSIRNVEKYLGDYILDHTEDFYIIPKKETGKKVAIIGAGPAGLTAAYVLRSKGISVTVIDSNPEIGGMLFYGIPSYRLSKDILKRLKRAFEDMGIVFKMNTKAGEDVSYDDLKKNHDAVMIGTGAWLSQGIKCNGDDAEGVIGGIDFLNKVANQQKINLGRNVVVVGGGNTAMDACRTAKRMGAESVSVVYRRTQAEMPADMEEIIDAVEEGVDFKYLVNPLEIKKDNKGRIKQVVLQKMKLGEPDNSGRRQPIPIQGEIEAIAADTLIAAIGQNIGAIELPGLELGRRNEIIINSVSCMTNVDKVFASGDVVNGPKTVVEAIAGARKTAGAMAAYLGVEEKSRGEENSEYLPLTFDSTSLDHSEASVAQVISVESRTVYSEDAFIQRADVILDEAKRCFNCGCVAVSPSDLAPALIALDAVIVTTERRIPASDFFAIGIESSTILRKGEFVTEIVISSKKSGSSQAYRKFRTRKSIDFPIAGLASNILIKDGKITGAKLVFSGIAPIPYEFKNVEAFLIGQEPTAETAEAAGKLALEGIKPLNENFFKVQLIRTFVRRAVIEAI